MAQLMPREKVLICGAGVAGSILAFWLARYGFEVVVVERSKAGQKAGQGIEIEEPAIKVVKSMGILDTLNSKRTIETGFKLVDQRSRSWGVFEIGGLGITGALELMRGDLTEVLYKAANNSINVTFEFETTIQSLTQTSSKVIVELENRRTQTTRFQEFDYMVGADGVKSRTRQLIMGDLNKERHTKAVGAYVAYFSIPKIDRDWPYSRLCHFPGRKVLWTRPMGKDSAMTSAYLIHLSDDIPTLRQANAIGDRAKQKEGFASLYDGLGWETPRVIEQMMLAENFYSDELVQIHLDRWSEDRVVLLGDAAWAPTPFTGEGNQLAIIGAWVLAQELSRDRSSGAFKKYEKRFRPYVEKAQKIPLNGYAPYIFLPETMWGIWLFRIVMLLVSWAVRLFLWLDIAKFFPDKTDESFDLEMSEN